MDIEQARAAFERDGFVLGGPIISREEAAELAAELDVHVQAAFFGASSPFESAEDAMDLSKVENEQIFQLCNLFQVSDTFKRLMHNPRLAEMAAAVSGSASIQLWIEQSISKPAGTGSYVTWHQDGAYHRNSITPADGFIAAWVALDDCDESNGCMWMVPGSHQWGGKEAHLAKFRQNSSGDDFLEVPAPPSVVDQWRAPRPCPVKAGEVHFHHPHTWHGSPVNYSSRPRRAIAIHLMTEGAQVGKRGDSRVDLPPGTSMRDASQQDFPLLFPL